MFKTVAMAEWNGPLVRRDLHSIYKAQKKKKATGSGGPFLAR